MVAHAQWSHDPANNLIVGYGLLPEICSDSAGGAYITYENATAYPRKIALRRLNRFGYQAWSSARLIQGIWPESRLAKIAEDGRNGALIGFTDIIVTGQFTIDSRGRVQRVDSNGNLLWGPTGTRVTLAENNHGISVIASDGHGGCVVAWYEATDKIRAQRIDSVGSRVWGDSGVLITSSSPYEPMLVRTVEASFMIGYGTFITRVNGQGIALWRDSIAFRVLNMVPDNRGGLIAVGKGGTANNILIITQRIDSSGHHAWVDPFVVLSDSADPNSSPIPISATGIGNYIFAWNKKKSNITRAFTQKLNLSGIPQFADGGIVVSKEIAEQGLGLVVASQSRSTVYIWADSRMPNGIYAQRLDSLGRTLWDTSDVAVNIPFFASLKATSDGSGGSIAVGFHQFDFSVRALQVSVQGVLGQVSTNIDDNRIFVIPERYVLHQNYPNPFNSITTIAFDLPFSSTVSLEIYNLLGERVRVLFNERSEVGNHRILFEAGELSSGMYFLLLRSADVFLMRKLVILK